MELIAEKAFSGTKLNADLPFSFWSSGATIKQRANSTKALLMVRCKWKGSALGDIGALVKGWLKDAKAPLPLRNQLLVGSQASQSNQAIKSLASLTRTLRSVAAPRRLLQR